MNALRFQPKEFFILFVLLLAVLGVVDGGIPGTISAIILGSLACIAAVPQVNMYIVFGLGYKRWRHDALVKVASFLVLYSGLFLLIHWWLEGNSYLHWLLSAICILVTGIIATRRWVYEGGRNRTFNQNSESSEELFAGSPWLERNAARGVLWGSYIWFAVVIILLITLVAGVTIADYLVHSATGFGSYLSNIGLTIVAIFMSTAFASNSNPRKILGQWLLYGNNRKTWMRFTIGMAALSGLVTTMFGIAMLQLSTYFSDHNAIEQLRYAVWLLCVISFVVYPLRETIMSMNTKIYYPFIVMMLGIIGMIVLAATGIVTGCGQLILAIALFSLWAVDFLRRAKTMAPEYATN